MTNNPEPLRPKKKPSGCWWLSGCLLTVVSALMFFFFIYMIFYSEEKLDESRAEYAASMKEYEEQLAAYEADSVAFREQYHLDKPEYVQRGHIGVNIGAAFFVVFALFMLVPMAIGLVLLLYYRHRYRKWRIDNRQETWV